MKKTIVILMSILFVFCTANSVLADTFTSFVECEVEGGCWIDVDGTNGPDTGLNGEYIFTLDLPGAIDYSTVSDFTLTLDGHDNNRDYATIDPYVSFDEGVTWTTEPIVPGLPAPVGGEFESEYDLLGVATTFDGEPDFQLAWGCHFFFDRAEIFMEYGVPEPATMFLLGSGLVVLAGFGRKKFLNR